MTKGRVFAIIIVTLVLALMIGLFVTGMTRGAAWVLDVDSPAEGGEKNGRQEFSDFLDGLEDAFDDEDGGFSMFNFSFGWGHNWGSDFKNGTIVTNGSVEIGADDVKGIKTNWIGGRMTIKTHSSSEILLEQTSKSGSIPEDRRLVYRIDDGRLVLREGAGRRVSSRTATDLVIYLPDRFTFVEDVELNGIATDIVAEKQTLTCHDNIEVSVVSGNVNLEGADSEGSIKMNSTSGDMMLNGCRALGDVKLSTTSGNLKLYEVTATDTVETDTTSGDVHCENIRAAKFESDAVSGNVTVRGSSVAEADCSSVSGEITVESGETMRELDCDTTSGDIRVTLPSNQQGFTAKYGTVSGDFRCEFETSQLGKHEFKHGDGSAQFSFNTVSGDMQIIKD